MNEPTIRQVDEAVRAVLGGIELHDGVFAGRLLGLKHVGALAGSNEVRIAPGTVVTPLARDELKRLGIAVRVVAEGEARCGEWGFAVEIESGLTAALRRALLEGPASWREVGRATNEAARWVVGASARGVAFFTAEASVSVWTANQVPGVRAATAGEAEAVERAVRHLGVNFLAVEPAGKSISEMRHMLATFRRGGPPGLPPGLGGTSDEDRRSDRPSHLVAEPSQPAERALRDRLAHAARRLDGGFARSR